MVLARSAQRTHVFEGCQNVQARARSGGPLGACLATVGAEHRAVRRGMLIKATQQGGCVQEGVLNGWLWNPKPSNTFGLGVAATPQASKTRQKMRGATHRTFLDGFGNLLVSLPLCKSTDFDPQAIR